MSRKRSKHVGVYSRESTTRRWRGKPDVCWEITYKVAGVKRTEKVGWTSEGVTAEYAQTVRSKRVLAARNPEAAPPSGQGLTLAQAWDLYRRRHLAGARWERYEVLRYEAHLAHLGQRQLASLTPGEIEDLKRQRLAQGLSPATVRHILALLRQIVNKMLAWEEWAGPNPVGKIAMPAVDNARYRHLTRDEADALLAEVARRSPTWGLICLCSLRTGLRLGEILSLRWEHVDLAQRVLQIQGKCGRRTAYLTADLADALQARERGHELVFPSARRGQSAAASRTFARAVDALGLNAGVTDARGKVVFHTLRHTFASWLAMDGVPLYTIGALLGHTTLEMTQRYAHLSPDHKRQALAVMERAASGHLPS